MTIDLKIGIVGGGVVGSATAKSYAEHVTEVRVFDHRSEKSTHKLDDVLKCDLIFVCLPSPQKQGSLECDTSIIRQFFADRTLNGDGTYAKANYVLRSTVPIGFTRALQRAYEVPNLVHSPEFLTARCALLDAQIPSRNIIGLTGNGFNATILHTLYKTRWPSVPIFTLSSKESEAIKLFQNGFFATKVAYWNECRELADKLDLDWDDVMRGILADGRIHPSHTQVPGTDSRRGFGGACLPKDLANLIECHITAGLSPDVSRAAHLRNIRDRRGEAL